MPLALASTPSPTLPQDMAAAAEAMAAKCGLSKESVLALVTFLHRTLVMNDRMRTHFQRATPAARAAMITEMVTRWHTQTTAFLIELRDNTTPRAQAVREAILTDVFATLRARQEQA
jgi:hypothetical protein